MTEMRIVDTNIPLYAVSRLAEDADKHLIAVDLFAGNDMALSAQVMQEFYVQATRANRSFQLTHEETTEFINTVLLRFTVQAITPSLVLNAFVLRVINPFAHLPQPA